LDEEWVEIDGIEMKFDEACGDSKSVKTLSLFPRILLVLRFSSNNFPKSLQALPKLLIEVINSRFR
jgi:hypothetical protein